METILFLSRALPPRVVSEAAPALRIRPVSGLPELAAAAVEGREPLCVLVQDDSPGQELMGFLEALHHVFPRLPIGLVAPPARGQALPEGVSGIDGSRGAEELEAGLARFLAPLTRAALREQPRCSWSLPGALSLDRRTWQDHAVRSISAGGAFLERTVACPPAGSRGRLRIAFRDLQLLLACETLGERPASDILPAGFGVRFTDPTSPAVHILEEVVRDALLRSLLHPEEKPRGPFLGGRDLLDPAR